MKTPKLASVRQWLTLRTSRTTGSPKCTFSTKTTDLFLQYPYSIAIQRSITSKLVWSTTGSDILTISRQRPDPQPQYTETIMPMPFGLRMIAGDVARRSFSGDATDLPATAITYACEGNSADSNPPGMVNGTWYGFPQVKCPLGVRAQIYFPSCWDGVRNDSDDHKSHMSYYVNGSTAPDVGHCPDSHHVHVISLFMEFFFQTQLFDDEWDGDNYTQPFLWASGDRTGYGLHGDYVS